MKVKFKKISGTGIIIDNLDKTEYDYFICRPTYLGDYLLIPFNSKWLIEEPNKYRVMSTLTSSIEAPKSIKTDLKITNMFSNMVVISYDVLHHNKKHDIGSVLLELPKK